MKGYKAFEKGMICRGKQYAENTVFEEESAEICKSGMHFCKEPLDVLEYYPLVDESGNMSEFAEIEALDEAKTDDTGKYCTKKLRVGAKISFAQLVQASIEFEGEKTTVSKLTSDEKKARIGSSGISARIGSSGISARIGSSGNSAQIGSSGDWARIGSSGNWARIGSSGDSARIGSSGDSARIGSSGNSAQIGSSGNWARIGSSGKNSVICCAGYGCRARAKTGSWITLAEWGKDGTGEYKPLCVKTEYVDGERIKEDVLYKLENGEFVEAEK